MDSAWEETQRVSLELPRSFHLILRHTADSLLAYRPSAAILRIGLLEMSSFTLEFFPDASPETFSHHSAGVADLITTSFGGRNRKCAEAFVKTGKTFDELEEELLDGQKLQGTVTTEEIFKFLEARGRIEGYPLFEKVYRISFEGLDVKSMFEGL